MKKTLVLFRHAKSDWSNPSLDDIDRPLSPRGNAAAVRMGAEFAPLGLAPELILCSPAQRARETLALVLPAFSHEMEIRLDRGLYMASDEEILASIREISESIPSVMVIGHNPGMDRFALSLAGKGDSKSLKAMRTKFPTAALAVFSVPGKPWKELEPGDASLTVFVTPSSLSTEG